MTLYYVRRPYQDAAGNHKRRGDVVPFDPLLHAKGRIASQAELEAEAEALAKRKAKVTYEPHYYEK